MHQLVEKVLLEHQKVLETTLDELQNYIYMAALLSYEAILRGNKILVCGNGQSAAISQSIVLGLTGRFLRERKALPAMALAADGTTFSGMSKEYGLSHVFVRQVEAFAQAGDVCIGICSKGESENVYNALKTAREKACKTIGLTGGTGGIIDDVCDVNIIIPSDTASRIDEMHILVGNIIVESVDTIMKDAS